MHGCVKVQDLSITSCTLGTHYNYGACIKKWVPSQPAITFSKLTIEILEQGVKYVQS